MKKIKKKIKIFIWNEKIHFSFTSLLIVILLLMSLVVYVQTLKINTLYNELDKRTNILDDTNYNYEVVLLEDFFKGEKTPESITVIYKYLIDNSYKKIYLTKGFVEGEKIKNCSVKDKKEICDYELIRFNQKKGKYLEIISKRIRR